MQIPDMCIKSSPSDILSEKNLKLALSRQDSTEFQSNPNNQGEDNHEDHRAENVGEIQENSPGWHVLACSASSCS